MYTASRALHDLPPSLLLDLPQASDEAAHGACGLEGHTGDLTCSVVRAVVSVLRLVVACRVI